MDFRDTGRGADAEMNDVLEAELVTEAKTETVEKTDGKAASKKAATNTDAAYEKAESDSKTVDVRRFNIVTDNSRDALLTEFG